MKSRTETQHRGIDLDRETREQLEGEFQLSFFETAIQIDPCNLECLIRLGDLYTRQGHYEKGLAIDRRLVGLCPQEPAFHYNLACSLSLMGRCSDSLESLREAVRLGYDDIEHLQRDEDLARVRDTDGFRQLLDQLG